MGILGRPNNQAVARDRANQVMKLALNGLEIRENVGMIELEIIQDNRTGTIMNKLGPLIEKSGVVLIRFHDKVARPAESSGNCAVAIVNLTI
jgi:hypothetical protein